MKNIELINRLSRAGGQIDSIKKKIQLEKDDDCIKTLQQLKASINALKKFGEAYLLEHLEECMNKGMSPAEMKKNMKTVISGSFNIH